jgi:hypothetical protein
VGLHGESPGVWRGGVPCDSGVWWALCATVKRAGVW